MRHRANDVIFICIFLRKTSNIYNVGKIYLKYRILSIKQKIKKFFKKLLHCHKKCVMIPEYAMRIDMR